MFQNALDNQVLCQYICEHDQESPVNDGFEKLIDGEHGVRHNKEERTHVNEEKTPVTCPSLSQYGSDCHTDEGHGIYSDRDLQFANMIEQNGIEGRADQDQEHNAHIDKDPAFSVRFHRKPYFPVNKDVKKLSN